MPVSPTDWYSNSLSAVETVLANCAQFRTLMGAANIAAAQDKCYWQALRGSVTPPMTHLLILEGGSVTEDGQRRMLHTDTVAARIVWPEITAGASSEKDIDTLQLNAFGALMSQLDALVGTSAYLVRAVRTYEPPEPMRDDDATYKGCWDAVITFSWSI